ncbi:MAG: ABC transporter ATP-binding protein [bacterium]|nr:ABC transporter ATP-binding protein [bacterium]
MALLTFKDIAISSSTSPLVKALNLSINRGEILSIVGESGSGKSLSCLSILHLLPKTLDITGAIFFESEKLGRCDLMQLSEKEIQSLALVEIAYIFQEPMTALNPVLTCGQQLLENIKRCGYLGENRKVRLLELLKMVDLNDYERIIRSYPFQLSGGQRQRVMIAMALAGNPTLIIADEPTTALDVLLQEEILGLLKRICKTENKSLLFVSHDLDAVSQFSDRTAVMYQGEILEVNTTTELIKNPQNAYTKALLACKPSPAKKGFYLTTLKDAQRQNFVSKRLQEHTINDKLILNVAHLDKTYNQTYKALEDISFSIKEGESIGLIGESGSGKSTISKILVNLEKASGGHFEFNFKNGGNLPSNVQMVFQDPFAALNPSLKIKTMLEDVFKLHQPDVKKANLKNEMEQLLMKVGLQGSDLEKYPSNFSGGQRQRLCIARALAAKPTLLICDEATSALDLSVQAQILNLLKDLQNSEQLTILMITHSMAVAAWFCNRIIVLKNGSIVEQGDAEQLFANPENAYTKLLFEKSI